MGDTSVAIRLGTTGAADVRRDLTSIGDAGEAQAKRWSSAFDKANDDIAAAEQRRARASDKIAAMLPQTPTQAAYQAGASTNYGGESARDAAAGFRELLAEEDRLDAKARALTSTMEPLTAAQERYNATVADLVTLQDSGRISLDLFLAEEAKAALILEKVTGQATAAVAATKALSQAQASSKGVAVSSPDTIVVGKSAQTSAAAFQELMTAEEQLTARTNALRASIDPAWVAQGRFNTQMGEARSLIAQGAISLDDYCAKLRIETAALKSSQDAGEGVVAGHGRMSASGMILQHVMRSTTDSLAAGLPVTMILGEQISRLGEAAALSAGEGGGKGKLAALAGFMAGPWGFAFTAAIGVAGLLIPKLLGGADAADIMKEHQQQLATMMDQTTGKILEQNKALLLNQAIVSAKDGAAAKTSYQNGRTALSQTAYSDEDIAAAVQRYLKGGSAAQLAADALAIGAKKPWQKETTDVIIGQAAALVTYARTAEQAAAQQRLLLGNAKPGDQRMALGQFGPEKPDMSLVDAQAKLAASTTASDKAEAQATITRIQAKKAYDDGSITIDQYRAKITEADKAVAAAKEHTDKHAASLARQAESMEVSARGAIDVAKAYLQSSDAGLTAEARRKAATDATRKGISVDEQAARQLALSAAEQIMSSAKTVATLNDESAARESIVAKVRDGTVAAEDMEQALKVEIALRPLLAARAHLHGDALDALNATIDATTAALGRSTVAAGKFDIGKQIEDARQRAIELRAQISDLTDTPADASRNAAARAAQVASDKAKLPLDDPQRMDNYHAQVSVADAGYDLNRQKFVVDTTKSQKDSIELSEREAQLAGASDAYRTSELDKLKLQQQIRRTFPDMAQADVDKLVAGVAAVDAQNAKSKLLQDTWSEIRSAGDQFLTDLTNPDGSGLKSLLKDIEQEFIKLAALNPIKNLLLGEKNPTLTGVLGSLFGAVGASKSGFTFDTSIGDISQISTGVALPHNAAGTQDWSGGRTWLDENGPEVADLPSGTRIYPAAESRRMMAAANENGATTSKISIELNTPLFTATVAGTADQRIGMAAPAIGDGAANLAIQRSTNRQRRRMR